jgi:hypothetical protein
MTSSFIDSVFELFRLSKQPKEIRGYLTEAFKFEDGVLVFTLDGLYHAGVTFVDATFMSDQDVDPISFNDFQKSLYASNLNERLGQVGMTVMVKESTGKVKSNWYQLRNL